MASAHESGTTDDGASRLPPGGWFALAVVAAVSLPLFYLLAALGLPLVELPDRSAPSAYTAETAWPYLNAVLTLLVLGGALPALIRRDDAPRMLRPLAVAALAVLAGHAWYLWWGILDRTPEQDLLPLLTILLGCVAMLVVALVGLVDVRAEAGRTLPG